MRRPFAALRHINRTFSSGPRGLAQSSAMRSKPPREAALVALACACVFFLAVARPSACAVTKVDSGQQEVAVEPLDFRKYRNRPVQVGPLDAAPADDQRGIETEPRAETHVHRHPHHAYKHTIHAHEHEQSATLGRRSERTRPPSSPARSGAVQLLRPNKAHTGLEIVEEGVRSLHALEGPVAVVAAVGPYHSGKSFLLNELAGRRDVFRVGPSVDPSTAGVWAYPVPDKARLRDGREVTVLYLDTEGFSSGNASADYDSKVFAVSALLSSHLLYNTVKTIDLAEVERLELLARSAQLFAVRSQLPRVDRFDERLADLPPLTWIVQDFAQATHAQETPTQWLRRLLATAPRDADYRPGLSRLFPDVHCQTMFLPATDKALLRDLSVAEEADLTPEYTGDRERVRDHVIANMRLKSRRGAGEAEKNEPLSGAEIGVLLRLLVAAANEGAMGRLPSLWGMFVESQMLRAREDCQRLYMEEMSLVLLENQPPHHDHGEGAEDKEGTPLTPGAAVRALGREGVARARRAVRGVRSRIAGAITRASAAVSHAAHRIAHPDEPKPDAAKDVDAPSPPRAAPGLPDELQAIFADDALPPVNERRLEEAHRSAVANATRLYRRLLLGMGGNERSSQRTLEQAITEAWINIRTANTARIESLSASEEKALLEDTEEDLEDIELPTNADELDAECRELRGSALSHFASVLSDVKDSRVYMRHWQSLENGLASLCDRFALRNVREMEKKLDDALAAAKDVYASHMSARIGRVPRTPAEMEAVHREAYAAAVSAFHREAGALSNSKLFHGHFSQFKDAASALRHKYDEDNTALIVRRCELDYEHLSLRFTTYAQSLHLPMEEDVLEERLSTAAEVTLGDFRTRLAEFNRTHIYADAYDKLKTTIAAERERVLGHNVRAFANEVRQPLESAREIIHAVADRYWTTFTFRKMARDVLWKRLNEKRVLNWPTERRWKVIDEFIDEELAPDMDRVRTSQWRTLLMTFIFVLSSTAVLAQLVSGAPTKHAQRLVNLGREYAGRFAASAREGDLAHPGQ